jgi:hypothetical protein
MTVINLGLNLKYLQIRIRTLRLLRLFILKIIELIIFKIIMKINKTQT